MFVLSTAALPVEETSSKSIGKGGGGGGLVGDDSITDPGVTAGIFDALAARKAARVEPADLLFVVVDSLATGSSTEARASGRYFI